MQLGNCWFNAEKGELVNQDNGDSWHLPRAELQVLHLLIEYQGKLVAKPLLKSGDGQHSPLSDSSVTRAVFMLRSFLGPQHESLIETVKGQGYLLRHKRRRRQLTRFSRPFNPSWVWGLVVIALVMLVSMSVLQMPLASDPPPAPLKTLPVSLLSGQKLNVILYASSKTNNALLLKQANEMQLSLSECKASSWKNIYLSLSHDKQVLNMTLRGEYLGQSIVRNLKVSDLRQPKEFITQAWLKEVDICG